VVRPEELGVDAAEYRAFRGLFLSALAKLARQGYRVPVTDALDLIHDFFIEAWPGLRQRYNADRASFQTYAYGAFMRFARPRIVRMLRWRRTLSLDESDWLERVTAEDGEGESLLDVSRVRAALNRLSEVDRDVLMRRFGDDMSERAIAESRGSSRYNVRQELAESLARLVVAVGEQGAIEERDWKFAVALFGEHRRFEDAASHVSFTPAQAAAAQDRILRVMVRAIRGASTSSRPRREA
jgi:RNA polymerase sigma factor (sigma-70 family)